MLSLQLPIVVSITPLYPTSNELNVFNTAAPVSEPAGKGCPLNTLYPSPGAKPPSAVGLPIILSYFLVQLVHRELTGLLNVLPTIPENGAKLGMLFIVAVACVAPSCVNAPTSIALGIGRSLWNWSST